CSSAYGATDFDLWPSDSFDFVTAQRKVGVFHLITLISPQQSQVCFSLAYPEADVKSRGRAGGLIGSGFFTLNNNDRSILWSFQSCPPGHPAFGRRAIGSRVAGLCHHPVDE